MDKETFIDILKSKSMTLSSMEIQEILDEELDKSPEEMDTDLVDICLDALDGKFDDNCNKKDDSKKKIKISRILLIAAILAIILSISIPAGAKFLHIDASNDVVQYHNDYFSVDLNNEEPIQDIVALLENDGLSEVVLPKEFTDGTYKVSNYYLDDLKSNITAYDFDIYSNEYGSGHILIQKYENEFQFPIGKTKATSEFQSVKQIDKENYSIIVFGDNEDSVMYYTIDNIEYSISFDQDFSTVCEFAKGM